MKQICTSFFESVKDIRDGSKIMVGDLGYVDFRKLNQCAF